MVFFFYKNFFFVFFYIISFQIQSTLFRVEGTVFDLSEARLIWGLMYQHKFGMNEFRHQICLTSYFDQCFYTTRNDCVFNLHICLSLMKFKYTKTDTKQSQMKSTNLQRSVLWIMKSFAERKFKKISDVRRSSALHSINIKLS